MRRTAALKVLMIAAVLTAGTAHGQQSVQVNFSVAPPPLAGPAFEMGVTELKFRAAYFTLDDTAADIAGGGLDGVVRTPFSDNLAVTMQLGLFGMKGSMDTLSEFAGLASVTHSDLSIGELLLGANAEVQPFRGGRVTTTLFAGPALTLLFGNIKSTWAPAGPLVAASDSGSVFSYLYGVQGGGRLGVRLGNFHVGGFGGILSNQGRSTISWSALGRSAGNIPAATVVTYGLDLVYAPWDLTVSALRQRTEKKDQNQGGMSTIYQLSWTF